MPAAAVLINADDLGLWPSVDRGIFAAWSARAIGDSTVFANAPELERILRQAGEQHLPVGIHLNLTFGRPLSDPADLPAMVTSDGCFMKRQRWPSPLPVEQIRREFTRQVERVLALGWQPSHLDSHHHVHTYPEVLAVVIELARAYRLPVRSVDAKLHAALREAGIPTPSCFSMDFYGEHATVATLIRLVDTCADGTLEIMAHPGYADSGLPSSYTTDREHELAALTDPGWLAHMADEGVAIIGYDRLVTQE